MSISPRSGARGFERLTLPYLKYYNVLKWERRFTLGVNDAKNTDYLKKRFEWKFSLRPSSASLTLKRRKNCKKKKKKKAAFKITDQLLLSFFVTSVALILEISATKN